MSKYVLSDYPCKNVSSKAVNENRSVVKLHIKMEHVDNVKLYSLIALLSKYDLFHISTDDGREFNATEIVSDESYYLKFNRLFSTAVHSNGYIVDIQAISEKEFACKTPSVTYLISALHSKPQESIVRKHREWNEVADLMDLAYIGERFTIYDKESNMLLLVVDPSLLGELRPVEHRQIQHIINVYLGGYSNLMQTSRTVCFQIKLHDDGDKIFAGVYDLERQCPMTSNLVYDGKNVEAISSSLYRSSQSLLEYAKMVA